MSNTKTNRKWKIAIWAIVILAIIDVGLMVCSIMLWMSRQKDSYGTNLGQDIVVGWDGSRDIATNIIYYPAGTPSGIRYKQNISLKTSQLDQNYFVRAAIVYASIGKPISGTTIASDVWRMADDGYYYLNALVVSDADIAFAKSITTANDLNQDKAGALTIIFQFLPSNLDVYTIWDIDRSIIDLHEV